MAKKMALCKSCGAGILWVKTEKGKAMPVDSMPSAKGNIELIDGVAHYRDDPTEIKWFRYLCHFATCPSAKKHRKE